jgi:hypothetical protein
MLTNKFSSLLPSKTCFNISPIHCPSTGASSPERRTSPRRINTPIHGNPPSAISSLGMSSVGGRRETVEQIKACIKMEQGLEKQKGTIQSTVVGKESSNGNVQCASRNPLGFANVVRISVSVGAIVLKSMCTNLQWKN